MPYKNIVFIKIFLALFEEDDRFLYQLNESQQLLFIKMLYMSAITDNKVPCNPRFICSKINYHHEEDCLFKDLDRIMEIFPGLKFDGKNYSFKNFHELHNYVTPNKGSGYPKDTPGISYYPKRDTLEKSRVDKIKSRERERIEKKRKEPSSFDPKVCNIINETTKKLYLGGKR